MKSKRFKITVMVLIGDFLIFYAGILHGQDPVALATGLSIINIPVIGYHTAETMRPSGTINGEKIQ